MSSNIEYIEPTQEHVGQMVEVRDTESVEWTEATLTGILHDDFRFAARCSGDKYSIGWRYARIPCPLTYAERQARCGLKVGDRVKFVRMWEQGSCDLTPFQSISKWVGSCGAITDIADGGMRVQFNGIAWGLPYFVLEKVEDRKAIHDDWGKTVYVDGSPQDEFRLMATYCEVGSDSESCVWFGVVRNNDKRFVYELSNLRVKE